MAGNRASSFFKNRWERSVSAEIIHITDRMLPPNSGNGAREALIEIGIKQGRLAPEHWADLVLMELWARGFRITPMEDGPCG